MTNHHWGDREVPRVVRGEPLGLDWITVLNRGYHPSRGRNGETNMNLDIQWFVTHWRMNRNTVHLWGLRFT